MATSALAINSKVAVNLKSSQMKKEVFKPVKGFESLYEVSDYGRVKSLGRNAISGKGNYARKGKLLKLDLTRNGYLLVTLYNRGKSKRLSVHRIVINTFTINSNKSLQVNHINGIKTDNYIENLEWCTSSENRIHGIKTGLVKPVNKSVLQFGKDGTFIAEYHSAVYANKMTGISNTTISSACNEKRKYASGFIWKFKNKDT